MDDEATPAACWICGRTIAPEEPRRLVPITPDDPGQPPSMTGVACLGCCQGRQQTSVPGSAEGRLTSRVLRVRVLALVS